MNNRLFYFALLNLLLKSCICIESFEKNIPNYNIEELNSFREGKKLLVLDIDNTLLDHKLVRPFLQEFLTRAYNNYDIVIWSATEMQHIRRKLEFLNAIDNPNYKIAFCLDLSAMAVIDDKHILVKPLSLIWNKYKQYSSMNTIIVDDLSKNFILNRQSGLWIKPFKKSHVNIHRDRELLKISDYLEFIAQVNNFQTLNHNEWEKYRIEKFKSPNVHCKRGI
ncbi:ubiquitin-like domain-containing CTD phosphatase 1 [Leptopilina heterotoma]|uniref:ubiquitin-like domain-containing CTD phosphatase 1 n=1 Tax=Leptopilina heterotoma TaxID=63436 RepID=UPI001CA8E938|nr:ubiquitin-like domain-containing CTD phosphatase 1 [Leptopilina heterotoma]XP_043462073.1 ubiquitin-like domain-containing CTD phosphatase 1 [Leptopilina heterotoma]